MRKLPEGETAFRELYRGYKKDARRRGWKFTLSKGFFRHLLEEPCHYCGQPPSKIHWSRRRTDHLIHSGIDRVNNKEGYHAINVVPCCSLCNFWKKAMNKEDFLIHAVQIVKHQMKKMEKKKNDRK